MPDVGHRELETEIPDPLEAKGVRKLWTLALPAVALSVASAAVFVLVLAFLMHDREMRALFVLPGRAGLTVSLVAALLAWYVVFACRRRPDGPGLAGGACFWRSSIQLSVCCRPGSGRTPFWMLWRSRGWRRR